MSSESDRSIRIGRFLLLISFGYLLLVSIGIFLWRVEGDPMRGDVLDGTRFVLAVGLMSAVYRGWRWSRWLLVALLALAAIGTAVYAQRRAQWHETRMILIGFSVFYGFLAVTLVSSRTIRAFLDNQRASRIGSTDSFTA